MGKPIGSLLCTGKAEALLVLPQVPVSGIPGLSPATCRPFSDPELPQIMPDVLAGAALYDGSYCGWRGGLVEAFV